MITNRLAHRVSTALAVVALSGCSAAEMKFYTLDPVATPGAAPAAHYSVLVGPVEIPPSLDRPQFVVQVAPNQVAIDELNCWAAPLDDGIARTLAADLAQLLATHDVAVAPLANFAATHRVTLNVQRFDSVPGRTTNLDVVWTVTPTALSGASRTGHSVFQEPVTAPGYDALAAAHSRAIAKMSAEIAAAIEESGKAAASARTRKR